MNTTECFNCKHLVSADEIYCSECGYPQNGSDDDKNTFERRIMRKKEVVKDAEKRIKNVKILLYVLAGLSVVVGLFYIFGGNENLFADGIVSLISGLVFIGCAIWVNKQPLTGILAAFIYWIVLQVLYSIVVPSSIFSGIIIKIIIIGVFIKGINSAKDASKYQEQLSAMKAK